MSEGTENNIPDGSWWGNWVQSAKEKSISVLNLMKQDLVEFGSVMQCDGSRVANVVREKFNQETAASASKKVKQGMTSLWGELSKALVIPPDDDCYEIIKITDGKPVTFDRAKAQLYALQTDIKTYTEDPRATDDKYQPWMDTYFNLEEVKPEISDLLVLNAGVRSLYTQLVPLTVSNIDFWCRYFYKKYLLEKDESRRIALVKRAEEVDKNELTWDEEEDSNQKDIIPSQENYEESETPKLLLRNTSSNISSGKKPDIQDKNVGDMVDKDSNEQDICPQQNEQDLPSDFMTLDAKEKDTGDISADGSTGESPTDDWEKVCSNESDPNKAPTRDAEPSDAPSNEDWEEW